MIAGAAARLLQATQRQHEMIRDRLDHLCWLGMPRELGETIVAKAKRVAETTPFSFEECFNAQAFAIESRIMRGDGVGPGI